MVFVEHVQSLTWHSENGKELGKNGSEEGVKDGEHRPDRSEQCGAIASISKLPQ